MTKIHAYIQDLKGLLSKYKRMKVYKREKSSQNR